VFVLSVKNQTNTSFVLETTTGGFEVPPNLANNFSFNKVVLSAK
jgi:hypothetical protein